MPDHVPDLQAFADRARATGRLGIDTEFMGEGRYRALLFWGGETLRQVELTVD